MVFWIETDRLVEIIESLVGEIEIGKVYNGKITSIKPFGLFVNLGPKEGLCHISEVSHSRVTDLNDLFKEGDPLQVKVLEINDRGQVRLSHKVLVQEKKEFVLSRQVLKSGSSIGANIEEAEGGFSKKDFIAKMNIAYKEARETKYWIRLLNETSYLEKDKYHSLMQDCEEILKLL